MKHTKPHNSLKCPCCGEMRGPDEQRKFLKQIDLEVPPKQYVTLSGILLGNVHWLDARKGLVDWGCDVCLQSQRALEGKPSKQLFCDFAPHFAYFDKEKICRQCSSTFTFSKTDQKHWFEELGFWVQAEKVRCQDCQQQKKRRDKFSQLMAVDDYGDFDVVQEIIAFYLIEKEYQKAKHFLAIGKKQYANDSFEFATLHRLFEEVRQAE